MAVLVLVALVALIRLREPAPPAEAFEFPVAPPDAARFATHYGGFRLSPDGRYLVVTLISDNRPSLWVRPIGVPEYRQIPGTDHALFPFWKPDSSEIGFFERCRPDRYRRAGAREPVCRRFVDRVPPAQVAGPQHAVTASAVPIDQGQPNRTRLVGEPEEFAGTTLAARAVSRSCNLSSRYPRQPIS